MATKTYDHAVIWNGKIIPANTPIEVEEQTKTTVKKNDKSTGGKS